MRIPTPKVPHAWQVEPQSDPRYTPVSVVRMKDWLAEEIVRVAKRDGLTPADIARRYPTIRRNDFSKIVNGDHQIFGVSRLSAVAEAIGISAVLGYGR